jgi:hypothetical protein
LHSLSAGVIALALLAAPNTELADCGNAADRTTAAAAKVIGALRTYESCLSSSAKPDARHDAKGDDCAAEMQALDDAHDNFADAVADAKTCR